ncbi:MAG: hypothetical protein U0223_07480 [Nitrospira sp.]|nr:hypothetical protein [Nitrospira sp.]
MTMTAVSRCSTCKAVVNIHWTACLVCRAIISSTLEVGAQQHTPDLPVRIGDPVALGKSTGFYPVSTDNSVKGIAAPNHPPPELSLGDVVEWLSPALPRQQGEVLALYDDGTFEVWHPLTKMLCRLPRAWVTQRHGYDSQKQEGMS